MSIISMATLIETALFEADRLRSHRMLAATRSLDVVAEEFASGLASAEALKAASFDLMDAIPVESDLTTSDVVAVVRMALVG